MWDSPITGGFVTTMSSSEESLEGMSLRSVMSSCIALNFIQGDLVLNKCILQPTAS